MATIRNVSVVILAACLMAGAVVAQDKQPKAEPTEVPPALRPASLRVQHPNCSILLFSPDGRLLITASHELTSNPRSGRPSTIKVWDVATGKLIGEPSRLTALSAYYSHVSPDSKFLVTQSRAVAADGKTQALLHIWELPTLKLVGEPRQIPAGISRITSSTDGKLLTIMTPSATSFTIARKTTPPSRIQLWELATAKPVGDPWTINALVYGAAFLKGNKELLLSIGGMFEAGYMQRFDLTKGALVGVPWPSGSVDHGFVVDPDSQFVVSQSVGFFNANAAKKNDPRGVIRCWDVTTGKSIGEPIRPQHTAVTVSATDLGRCSAIHTDARTVAATTDDRTLQLFNAQTGGKIGSPLKHVEPVYFVRFSHDGKLLLTASGAFARSDGCWLWDVASSKRIARVPVEGEVTAVSFDPNGNSMVTCNDRGNVDVWELSKRK